MTEEEYERRYLDWCLNVARKWKVTQIAERMAFNAEYRNLHAAAATQLRSCITEDDAWRLFYFGLALSEVTIGDLDANLRQAIKCYQAALKIRTEQAFPEDWAETQKNMGIALKNAGRPNEARTSWSNAARGYRNIGQVYAEYHINHRQPKEYEVDHLISLELGGSNSIKNLWPESYRTQPWNAHVKDKLENHLHKLVCDGKITLKTAQQEIAKDWIAAYKKYFPNDIPKGSTSPSPGRTSSTAHTLSTSSGAHANQVWVNLDSGLFFKQGSRYYGKTKHGKFMPEPDALKAGYHPAQSH